jgi:YggT family protein
MHGPLGQILDFLIGTLFGLYVVLLLLRMLFGLVRADHRNPVSQAILLLTNPPLRWLRPLIPPIGRLDLAAVLLVVLLKTLELWLRLGLLGLPVDLLLVLLAAVREVLVTLVWILIISLVIEVVLSWVLAGSGGRGRHPIGQLVAEVNRPILGRIRRILPSAGGLDFSPMLAMFLLYVVLILLRSL